MYRLFANEMAEKMNEQWEKGKMVKEMSLKTNALWSGMYTCIVKSSLVPRPSHVFQCETLKNMGTLKTWEGLGMRLVKSA